MLSSVFALGTAAALALAPTAMASDLPDYMIEVNVTVWPQSPFFKWTPGIYQGQPSVNQSDLSAVRHQQFYWTAGEDKEAVGYYMNFTSMETYLGDLEPPKVEISGYATQMIIEGIFDDWNISNTNDPLYYTVGDETTKIPRADAIASYKGSGGANSGSRKLATVANMTDGKMQTVEFGIDPKLLGGVALSVEQVTFTTRMKLQVKKPGWKESVNETEIAFVKDGNQNYINCGNVNDNAIGVEGSCEIKIPDQTSFIVLYGNLGPDMDTNEIKFSGLETDTTIKAWAAGFFGDQPVMYQPLDHSKKYTLKVDGNVELTKMKLYSQKKNQLNMPKIPWIIVGPAVGGGIVLIILAAVLYRWIAMGFRRRKRNSVLELRRMSTAQSGGGGSYQPLLNNAAPPGVDSGTQASRASHNRSISQSYAEDFELGNSAGYGAGAAAVGSGASLLDTQSRNVSNTYSQYAPDYDNLGGGGSRVVSGQYSEAPFVPADTVLSPPQPSAMPMPQPQGILRY